MKRKQVITVVLVLALVAIAVWLTQQDSTTTLQVEQTDFAIEDTSTIDKIVLSGPTGASITLEKFDESKWYSWVLNEYDGWMLNGERRARQDAVDLLLKTFRRIQVKSSVPKSAFESIVSQISATHIKVDIYQGDEVPAKTWYVGNATQDHYGTYMLLETPEHGKSAVPHIMHLPGFYGFLTARFFMDEKDWRWTGVFNYHPSEIGEISVDFGQTPSQSYKIRYDGTETLFLLNGNGQEFSQFDTLLVKNYILQYKMVHFEGFDTRLSDFEKDSLLNTTPLYTITVTDQAGEPNQISIWNKKALKGTTNAAGELLSIDPERKNAYYKGEWIIVQNYVFDHLFVPLNAFVNEAGIQAPLPGSADPVPSDTDTDNTPADPDKRPEYD